MNSIITEMSLCEFDLSDHPTPTKKRYKLSRGWTTIMHYDEFHYNQSDISLKSN